METIETNNIIDEVAETSPSGKIVKQLKELTIAVTKSYICNKEVLTAEEARLYLDVSPTYWKALVMDKAFPIYTLSSNKTFVRRVDLDSYVMRSERMILSASQIQQEARAIARFKK